MFEGEAAPRAAFFWLCAAVAGLAAYAALNEPVRYALLHLLPLAFAIVFIAACAGYGLLARAPDLLTAAALGIGIFGALSFFAALLHLARPWTYVVFLVIGLLILTSRARKDAPPMGTGSRAGGPSSLRSSGLVIVIIIVLTIPFVAAPDVSTDALEYHLLVPKTYLVQNAITYLPHFVESNYPSLAEYDFMALLALGDDRAAKAFHFLCGMLVLLAIGRLTTNKWIGAALFFSMPIVAITSGWAWNDMLFTLFVVMSIACIIEERFILAGVLFGFATWTKYTFVLAACGMIAVLIGRKWRDIVRFAIPVIAIAAIWMAKNAILTGNPVYPFLNSIFHSPFWTEAADHYFRSTLTRFEIPQWHWWTWFAFPAVLTLKPRIIDVHPGVLPLILLPLAFLRPRRTALHAYVIGVIVAWLFIRTETRSLLTVLAVLSAIYATHIERLPRWRWIVAAGVAMNLAIIMIATNIITTPARYFLGLETRRQYVEREDVKQGVYTWLNEQSAVNGVLLVGLHDPYYLAKPALFSSCCDAPVAQVVDVNTLKPRGITHIAFRGREFARENNERLYSWTPQQRDGFLAFLRERCRPVVRIGEVTIFQLL